MRCTGSLWTPIPRSCAGWMVQKSRPSSAPVWRTTSGVASHSWSTIRAATPTTAGSLSTTRVRCSSITADSMGEGMFVNFDGTPLVEGSSRPDEIITCELRPDLVREARAHWGVENNIYQFGHRGYVAVHGGARDCPYT